LIVAAGPLEFAGVLDPEPGLELFELPQAATPAATMIAVAAVMMRLLVNFDLLGWTRARFPAIRPDVVNRM
jgi:hypothetical protein